jgi:hypothetical protein
VIPALDQRAFINEQTEMLLFLLQRQTLYELLNLSKAKLKLSHLDSTACRRLGAPGRRARASVAPAATPPGTDCAATIHSNPIEQEVEKGTRFRGRSKNRGKY